MIPAEKFGVGRTALIAAGLIALSPLTLSMYGPSMPAMVSAFDATRGQVQATLVVYLVAFALAQLAYGPITDRFGRRPVVFAGLSIYLVGCIVGGLSQSIEMMFLARVLEGIGACGGSASSRAFVRDLHVGPRSARVFSLTGVALAIAPALGPAMAGYLQQDHGWQSVFVVLGAVAALLMLVLWFVMPESLARQDRQATQPLAALRGYLTILRAPAFQGPALLLALGSAGTYYYVAIAPFVLIEQLGLTPDRFGLLMPLLMVGYIAASGLVALLVGRVTPETLVRAGLLCGVFAALALFLLLRFDLATVPSVIVPLVAWMAGIALQTPGATTAALAPFADRAGSAAATLGFLQMMGSGLGALAAALDDGLLLGLAPVIFLLLAALAFVWLPACSSRKG